MTAVDLLAALQDGVRAARKSRGEDTDDEPDVHEISGQRSAPKKKAAKKTSPGAGGKRTAAKKSPRKRPAS